MAEITRRTRESRGRSVLDHSSCEPRVSRVKHLHRDVKLSESFTLSHSLSTKFPCRRTRVRTNPSGYLVAEEISSACHTFMMKETDPEQKSGALNAFSRKLGRGDPASAEVR